MMHYAKSFPSSVAVAPQLRRTGEHLSPFIKKMKPSVIFQSHQSLVTGGEV